MLTKITSIFLRGLRYLYAFLGGVFWVALGLFLVTSFVFTIFEVNGESMEPTLQNNNLLFINRLAYVNQSPRVGDIVVIQYTGNESVRFVKRIVSGPGVQVSWSGHTETLPAGEYFVEGDNRNYSTDSRTFGPIKQSQIIGKVVAHFGLP